MHNISWAIERMRDGFAVYRESQPALTFSLDKSRTTICQHIGTSAGRYDKYIPSQRDLLANDWLSRADKPLEILSEQIRSEHSSYEYDKQKRTLVPRQDIDEQEKIAQGQDDGAANPLTKEQKAAQEQRRLALEKQLSAGLKPKAEPTFQTDAPRSPPADSIDKSK